MKPYFIAEFKNRLVKKDFYQDQQTQNCKEVHFCVPRKYLLYTLSSCNLRHTEYQLCICASVTLVLDIHRVAKIKRIIYNRETVIE